MSQRKPSRGKIRVKELMACLALVILALAFIFNLFSGGGKNDQLSSVTPTPMVPQSIAACRLAIRAELRQRRLTDPYGTADPESVNLFSIYGGELSKTPQGYSYQISVNDTYASHNSKYRCTTNDAGEVTNISHQ